ncbi:hypothetical protein PDJAM_G00024090 [Pangasius djambal]|uniref:Uncharacterized protein n=1 Tax=Pangasius djambal TaxID=1691987 RepID=A0ACC5YP51_9TELE|nr:hypothetical protein [Pangasius djambal]
MSGQTFEEILKSNMERGMKLKDEEKLYKRNWVLYSTVMSPPENLDALKDLEAREDDVLLVAYPKCGSNWMVGVLRKIMTTCGYILPERPPLIEFYSPDAQKMLVVFRNPKDTAVSYYHFTNKNPVLPNAESWDKFLSDFITGEGEVGDWKNHFSEAQSKQMDEEFKKKLSGTKLGAKLKYEQYCEVGDWKNHFSEAQSKQMDEEFKKKLSGTKLGAKLKYEQYCQ